MTRKKYLTIITVVTVLVIVGSIVYNSLAGFRLVRSRTYEIADSGEDQTFSESYGEAIGELSLDVDAMNVTIETGDATKVEYSGPSRLEPVLSVKNGKMEIRQKKGRKIQFGIGAVREAKLTVVLKEGADLTELGIDVDAGNLKMKGVTAAAAEVDMDAGNLEWYDCEIDRATIGMDAGNLEIHGGTLADLTADVNMGNVSLDGAGFAKLYAEVDMGNITVDAAKDLSEYRTKLKVDLGKISVNGESAGSKYENQGSGAGELDMEVNMGNISLSY